MGNSEQFRSSMQVPEKCGEFYYKVGGELVTWSELLPEQKDAYFKSKENRENKVNNNQKPSNEGIKPSPEDLEAFWLGL